MVSLWSAEKRAKNQALCPEAAHSAVERIAMSLLAGLFSFLLGTAVFAQVEAAIHALDDSLQLDRSPPSSARDRDGLVPYLRASDGP